MNARIKKTLLAILSIATLLLPLVFNSCGSPKTEGFAIYLTRDDVPVAQMSLDMAIADESIIATKDIITYYKDTHEIELTDAAYERVKQINVSTSGTSFIVCLDKKPVYWGAFWLAMTSIQFKGATIFVQPTLHISQLTGKIIQIWWTGDTSSQSQDKDPRSNPDDNASR